MSSNGPPNRQKDVSISQEHVHRKPGGIAITQQKPETPCSLTLGPPPALPPHPPPPHTFMRVTKKKKVPREMC